MQQTDHTLALMAEVGAMRKFLISAVALKLLDEPSPLDAWAALGVRLAQDETMPGDHGGALDPAVSDMLAAETDERVMALVGDLGSKLRLFLSV
jgi:hypothetical protein